jgi:hypothetical protein
MAELTEKIVSPGVFTKELDQSFLPSAIGDIGGAVVGPTVKGPVLSPTVVSSYSEYQEIFGSTFKSGSQYYSYLTSEAAREYLKHGSRLTVVRVVPGSPTAASATISSSVDPSIVGGGTKHTGSITLVGLATTGLSLNASDVSASFTPFGGSTVNFVFTGSTAERTNTSTLIYVNSGSTSTLPNSATEFSETFNNSASLHTLPLSASSDGAQVQFTSSVAGNFGVLSGPTSGITPTPLFGGSQANKFVEIGGSPVAITSKSLSGGQDFNDDGDTTGPGFRTPFKLHTLGYGTIMNNVGPVSTNNILSSGSINSLRWQIGSINQKKGTFSLVVRRGNDTSEKKQILESWSDLSLDENSSNYISKRVGDQYISLGGSGTSNPYLVSNGTHPNKSKYVRVEVLRNTTDYLDENGNVDTPDYSASLPSFHSGSNSGSLGGSFSGGGDGDIVHPQQFYENVSSDNVQGVNPSTGETGKTAYEDALNLLRNQDEFDINLIMLPGIVDKLHTSIITTALSVCKDRGDCFLIADPVEYSMNITDAITRAEARDSSFGAMYWPWIKISQNELGRDVWIPPSVAVAGVYAFNDKVGHEWFAPAGMNRGTIDRAIQAERKLTHKNRDELYESNVNPLATFPGQGVMVYGQKTLQKKESALDRVNVRRLLIRLKKFIASSSRFLVFESNNSKTRARFLSIVNPYMEQVQSNSGLNAFKVVMDGSNNTPDVIDRNILYGQIFVQPTRTAEFIVLDFTIQATGATFGE